MAMSSEPMQTSHSQQTSHQQTSPSSPPAREALQLPSYHKQPPIPESILHSIEQDQAAVQVPEPTEQNDLLNDEA